MRKYLIENVLNTYWRVDEMLQINVEVLLLILKIRPPRTLQPHALAGLLQLPQDELHIPSEGVVAMLITDVNLPAGHVVIGWQQTCEIIFFGHIVNNVCRTVSDTHTQ